MSHAEMCPVCKGSGKVMGAGETGTQPTQTCHGCDGKGWVEVGDSIPVWPLVPHQPYPQPTWPYSPVITYSYGDKICAELYEGPYSLAIIRR